MGRDRSRSRSRDRGDRGGRGRDGSPPRRRHDSPPRRRQESPRRERRYRSGSPAAQRQRGDSRERERPRRGDSREREPARRDDRRQERRHSPPPPRDRERGAGRDRDREGDRAGPRSDWPDERPREQRSQCGGGGRGEGGPGGREPRPHGPGGRGGGRPRRDRRGEEDEGRMQWGTAELRKQQEEEEQPDKEVEPEFGLSGALAAEANKVNGVVLVHTEPPEARKPSHRWRLYVFKNEQPFGDPLHIHRQSSYLFGRERRVADVPTDHPSCSKQHAVLQFRLTEKEGADGMMHSAVRPYIMDLGSTNGTFVNGERLEAQRYYELLNQDLLKFGNSSREYVLLRDDTPA